MPCRRVGAVDGPGRETHGCGLIGPNLNAGLLCRRRIEGDLVVLKDVRNGQASCTGEVHGFPEFTGRGSTLADARYVESVKGLSPCGKRKSGHGCRCNRKRRRGWKHADVPRTDVQVSATGIVPTSVLVGVDLTEVRRHDIQRCIAHGQTQTDVANHRGNEVTVVTLPRSCITWCVGLALERCCDGDHAFLPG